jgi:hypothetical protein
MPRIKSEMFEKVAEILEEAGLSKEAYPSLESYKDDAEARVGSDDISTIEALYGVKPDGQEYEFNIMEQAHPNSVIVAPSYDKLNGLVENNIERNKIMMNITLTDPTGNHTNHKYAQQELTLELVRIANEMDTMNKEELFKLADSCLIDLSACQRRLHVKTAVPVLAIAALAASVLGAGWLLSHSDNPDHGPTANCDAAIKELTDLKTNSWYESDIDNVVKKEVDELIVKITQLKTGINEFNEISDVVYKPRTLSELKEVVKLKEVAQKSGHSIQEAVKQFREMVMELEPYINQSIENFSNTVYQKQHTKPSMIGEMTGWLGEALHGRWGLVANDFVSAVNALNPLKKSLEEMVNRTENYDKVVAKYEKDVSDAAAKFNVVEETSTTTTFTPTDVEPENDYASLISDITGEDPKSDEIDFLKHLMGN